LSLDGNGSLSPLAGRGWGEWHFYESTPLILSFSPLKRGEGTLTVCFHLKTACSSVHRCADFAVHIFQTFRMSVFSNSGYSFGKAVRA